MKQDPTPMVLPLRGQSATWWPGLRQLKHTVLRSCFKSFSARLLSAFIFSAMISDVAPSAFNSAEEKYKRFLSMYVAMYDYRLE